MPFPAQFAKSKEKPPMKGKKPMGKKPPSFGFGKKEM